MLELFNRFFLRSRDLRADSLLEYLGPFFMAAALLLCSIFIKNSVSAKSGGVGFGVKSWIRDMGKIQVGRNGSELDSELGFGFMTNF
ncbi:hypothetical protein M0R45_023429 [Rubus argutus]|uniref:Uncharacterized protein n=1 Tax=Rubus argutus TaxID=59490 RepID=A0AAW1WPF9_RUBAR